MAIIMLTGNESKGKTSSLHFVHEILVTGGGKSTAVNNVGSPNYRDFSDIVEYNNKRIAIFTAGDIPDHLKKTISLYETKQPDFLICACNNKLNEFFKDATHRIEKTLGSDLQSMIAANWYDAWRIIAKLEDCLKVGT